MDIYPKSTLPIREVKKFILIFYTVGVLGFLFPFTKEIFVLLTPFALILGTYLVAVYHQSYSRKDLLGFVLVFMLGFWIEVIGVKTGFIFGNYTYGKGLGFKLLDTPLLIGINWLFLVYASISLSNLLKVRGFLVVFVAPLLMLCYDLVLEQVASRMDMWTWQNAMIPLKNYVAWYVIGVLFVALFKLLKIETRNAVASLLLTCQFVFFIFLTFLLNY